MGVTANDSNYGIGKVADHTFNIGATLTLNNLSDKTLRCLLHGFGFQEKENSGCFLLTTAAGAASSGFSGAVYNSVYSSTDIDGGLVQPAAGMTRTNLGEIEKAGSHRQIQQNVGYSRHRSYNVASRLCGLFQLYRT